MPRPKPTDQDIKDRKARSKEWKTFRRTYKITQKALVDLMEGVGCRRTIQMIEAGKITPHKATLERFKIVKNRYEAGLDIGID